MTTAALGLMPFGMASAQQTVPAQPTPAQKVQPNQVYNGPIQQTPWFNNPAIRQQLKLNDTQYNQLNKVYGGAWTQYQKGINNLDPNMPARQRLQSTQDLQQRFYGSLITPAGDIITDPAMRNRFNQLNMQYRGYDAFQDPTIQNKLNLTADQRQKLNQYQSEWRKSMADIQRAYQTDPQAAAKQFNEFRLREADRLNNVLTDTQRQSWQQMVGTPYNFQPSVYFPQTNQRNPGRP